MEFIDWIWNYFVVFLLILSVLIYVHEWGHYWVARRNGVHVEVFSIGFGPELFGWTNAAGTRWKICLLPLGGYVKMFGENDGHENEDTSHKELSADEKAISFHHKSLGQRAAIVAAGPLVNFIFAIIAFAGLAMFKGDPVPLSVVGEIIPKSAAEEAGLQTGDIIVAIDNKEISTFKDLRNIILSSPGTTLTMDIMRDNQVLKIKVTPQAAIGRDGEPGKIGLLGVRPHPNHVRYDRANPLSALWLGTVRTFDISHKILVYVGEMISGERNADELGGLIRIAKISGDMAQLGFAEVILIMAMLSVNLGLINLFPIPILDGGHLAFYAAEAIRGRPLGPKAQEYGLRFGLILVLVLFVFVTWNDIVQLKVVEFIKELFV